MKKTCLEKLLIGLLLFITVTHINAQTRQKIRFIDESDNTPISGMHFSYSGHTGVSDFDGNIEIQYHNGAELILTHVSYGRWSLSDNQVISALRQGFFKKEMASIDLQPVSIVALRKGVTESKKIDLNYLDKQHHDGGAILSFEPSIATIRKSGSYGFDPVLRGFKYDQLNIVIDGAQGALAACPNRMDPATSQVALNMIDHIEILKGPYSLRFGNSFGGTINFVSDQPDFTGEFKPYGRISSSYESNGNISRTEGFVAAKGEKIDLKLFGSWSVGDDYKDGDGNIVPADMSRASFGGIAGLRISGNQSTTLSVTRNIGRDTDFPALPMDLRKDDTWMLNARHSITFRGISLKSLKSMVYGTFVDHQMDNLLKVINPRTVNAESPTQTKTYGLRTEGSWNFSKNTLYTGIDFKTDEASGSRYREMLTGPNAGKTFIDNSWQSSIISQGALFTEAHLNTSFISLVLSGRLSLNSARIRDAAGEFTGVNPETSIIQVNPCFSFGAVKNFNELFSGKLWLGRSQRSGSITERYINYFPVGMDPYELLGNPGIKPEVNNQADIIFELKSGKTFLNVDVFASYLENYISPVIMHELKPRLPGSPGVRQYQNTGSAIKTGFEVSWKQSLFLGIQHQMGFAYTYGKSLETDGPLPEIAPFDLRYSLYGSYFKNRLVPEVTLRHVMKQERISEEFGERQTPGFTVFDFEITYKLFNFFNISGGIQNLFDIAYYEHLNRSVNGNQSLHIYNPGRSIFLAVNLNFNNPQ